MSNTNALTDTLFASYYARMNSPQKSHDLLSEMIGLIYEAAVDLSMWPSLLESMSDYLALSLTETSNLPKSPDRSEHSLIRFLLPHFERANAIHQQLAEVSDERNLLESVMNRLPLGAAIIDAKCNTISMNRTLISLLHGSELLKLSAGRLVSHPAETLQQVVDRIISGAQSDGVIRFQSDHSCLSLWVGRGSAPSRADMQKNRLMVLVASRTSHALSTQGMISLFGLTLAEAKIAQQLVLGSSMEETAEFLQISRNTAKTQLARVFSKVGVKRQAELIQAIYASPLWLQSDPKQDPVALLDFNDTGMVRHATEDQCMKLPDGRLLYFSDSGDQQGHPVILMHGIAGSRYLRHPDDDIIMQEGIRLIIPERPGSGDSTPQADRSIADWSKDIAQLADHLQLDRFSVLGYSAGTAYALSVAAALPERICGLHLVAVVPPIDGIEDLRAYNPVFRMSLFLAKYTPSLLDALMRVMVKDIRKNVYHYLEEMLRGAPEQDLKMLCNPRLRANLATGLRASVRHGEHEVAREVTLLAKDWGVDLSQITIPLHIWHGGSDPLVSSSGAEKLATLLPDVRLNCIPGAGHYLMYSHWQELLRSIRSGM